MISKRRVFSPIPLLLLLALSACSSSGSIDLMDPAEELPASRFDNPEKPKDIWDLYITPDVNEHWANAIGFLSLERSMDMAGVEITETCGIPLRYPLGRDRESGKPWWVVGYGEGEFIMEIPASGPAGEGELGGMAGTAYTVRGYFYPSPKCKLELYLEEFIGWEVEGHVAYGDNEVVKGVGETYNNVTVLPEMLSFDLKTVPLDTYAYSKTEAGMTLNIKEVYFIRHFEDPSSGCTKLSFIFSIDSDPAQASVERGAEIIDGGWWEDQKARAIDEVEKSYYEDPSSQDE